MKTKPLAKQVAIVTGGGTGIGRALTEALAAAEVKVVIASRREDVLSRTVSEVNAGCNAERVFSYPCDILDCVQIESLVDYVFKRFGSIDVLINNAGLAVPETVEAISETAWDTVLDTNVRSVMRLVRAVLPHMVADDFGDIVNVSSQAGKHGYADVPAYCASKFGLLGYAEALRDHVRKIGANVRVFNFCPGLVDVENTAIGSGPRPGFVHVTNMARTLMYALSLDRNVVLEDISFYAR